MINLRKQRQKFSRNSLMLNASSDQALIQIKLNAGCFKGQDVDELNSKDALVIYNFLCSLLAYGLRTLTVTDASRLANIVVLIDSSRVPLKVLRVILRASQNALAYKIKHAIVIEPDNFFEQQRINLDILLEAYDFKTTMCSPSKIWKYVDITSMYQFKESSVYQPTGWTDIKKKFEDHFNSNPAYFTTDINTSCIDCLVKFLKKDQSVMIELSTEIKKAPEVRVQMQEECLPIIGNKVKPEESSAAGQLSNDVQAMDEEDSSKQVPNHIVKVLEERNLKIQEIIAWVEGPCEDWFKQLSQVCRSVDEVQRLESQRSLMLNEFQSIRNKASELFNTISYLRSGVHGSAYDAVSKMSLRMNELLSGVEKRAEHSLKKLDFLKKFYAIASEFYEEADILVKSLCTDPKKLELATLKSELKKLDYKVRLIEKGFEVAVETCTNFCALVKEEHSDAEEQPAEIAYLSGQLSLLNERRRRCLGLTDIRRLKVQQLTQLLTCEQDAQQVIEWINELQQNAQSGDPITKISKFEDVAKKMEQYGNQLCEVSLLLRRSLRLEVQSQVQLQQNLQNTHKAFNEAVKRLKMSQSLFYK